jgi:hypothetical protein
MDDELTPTKATTEQGPSKSRRGENNWIIGLALLIAGGILLVQNLVGWQLDYLWFILLIVPAIGAFVTAWRRYQTLGSVGRGSVIRPVIVGAILLLTIAILIFKLEGQIILSILLVLAGIIGLLWAFL